MEHLHPSPHRCRMPHIWLLVWNTERLQPGDTSSSFVISGSPCIFQRMPLGSASGHCFELSQSSPCQVTILSNTRWVSSSSVQRGSYDGSPVSELALHPHHHSDDHISQHNCISVTVIHQDTHQLLPKLALLCCLDIFCPETVFLPGLGWVGDEWCKTAMNNQASAEGIRAGTWSRTCRSTSPVIRRGHCSMTGTKPFLYAGCILPAAPGDFASLRTRDWDSEEVIF